MIPSASGNCEPALPGGGAGSVDKGSAAGSSTNFCKEVGVAGSGVLVGAGVTVALAVEVGDANSAGRLVEPPMSSG